MVVGRGSDYLYLIIYWFYLKVNTCQPFGFWADVRYTKYMYRPERIIRSIIPDLRDNLPTSKIPASAVQESGPFANTLRLSEKVLPTTTREELISATESVSDGRYRARFKAGSIEKGTLHIHDYILDKVGKERIFSFVDAEHMVGTSKNPGVLPRTGEFRPRIANLLSIRLTEDPAHMEFTSLRFRTNALGENRQLFKSKHLLKELETMVASHSLPPMLAGHENEIIYYLSLRPEMARVQARYSNATDLQAYLQGETRSEMLKGRITTQRAVVDKILRYIQAEKFVPITESTIEGQEGTVK